MSVDQIVYVYESAHGRTVEEAFPHPLSPRGVGLLTCTPTVYNYRRMTGRDCAASVAVQRRWSDRVRAGEMTTGSAARYVRVFESFARYAAARGVDSNAVTTRLCLDFVNAALPGRLVPSSSTRRFRLTVVRAAFHAMREAGLASNDPTRRLRVDWHVGQLAVCPLTPTEAQRLRVAGRTRVTDTVRPAVVTVALAGGSHREASEAVVGDVDIDGARLRLGGPLVGERWVPLDEVAVAMLRIRIAAQRVTWRRLHRAWDPLVVPLAMHRPLVEYPANSVAPTVSMNLSRALNTAGVTRAGVRPRSVREYAANRTYALTGRVEVVANQLGLASLDTAAGFLDHTWQDRWGPTVRSNAELDG